MVPLEILFEDEWLVAINKPAGHLVHPADEPQPDDLVAMKILRDQINCRVHTVHRIDRPTCGVLLFGKDLEISKVMHRQFENREVEKIYTAIVEGVPSELSWVNQTPLRKDDRSKLLSAKTEFTLIESFERDGERVSVIEAKPESGRFHQIRKHIAADGFPILCDYRYAGIERSDQLSEIFQLEQKMQLQASSLSFSHPVTKKVEQISCGKLKLIEALEA